MPDPIAIRRAEPADRPALAEMLTKAFFDDPIVTWAFPDEGVRSRRLPRFFAWSLRKHVAQSASWTTPAESGAALWAQPGQWKETTREALQIVAAVGPGVGRRSPRVLRGLAQVEKRHPREHHLYLAVLGVDPAVQGQGLGSALIQPGLDHCDAERLPAYLETAKERNVPFYERHGFVLREQFQIPNGPPLWLMWRDPIDRPDDLRVKPR